MPIIPNPPANFTPVLGNYSGQGAFRFWCQTVLPLVYDDSLSYYELLNKVVNYLNNVISDLSTMGENIESLFTAYNQLQEYVNNYFLELDLQEEINNKLDEMASDGSLSTLLAPFIPALVTQWLEDNITPTTPAVDASLSIAGAAADAKATGDRFTAVVNNTEQALSKKMDAVYTVGELTPTETHTGYIWNGSLVSNQKYTAYKYSINENEIYNVKGVQPSSQNLLYRIYNSSDEQIATSISAVETGPGLKESNFTAPENSSYVWINTINTYGGNVSGSYYNTEPFYPPIRVEVINGGAYFTVNNFTFAIIKCGANDLINIYSAKFNGNNLFTTNTDWLGPYKIEKIGVDYADITTGGNHTANINGVEYKTAKTNNFSVYGDGKMLANGIYYAYTSEINWENSVMAGNTVTENNEGEYCLTEKYRIVITDDGKLHVEHTFTPTVNCYLHWYSGMQFAGSSFAPNVLIEEYTNSFITTDRINNYSNEKEVNTMKFVGNVADLIMKIDRRYGIAINTSHAQVTGNSSKAYFILQSAKDVPLLIEANKKYSWRGCYEFRPHW